MSRPRAGLDVGPTNTDAVLVDAAGHVLTAAKVSSVPGDPVASVTAALDALGTPDVAQVAIGLRGAASAIARRSGLCRVAVLRIGGPATRAVRPLFGWPADLLAAVHAGTAIVDGGGGLDPEDRSPLDRDAVARFAGQVAGRAEAVAVTGVFAPLDGDQEREAAEIVRAELGPLPVSLSADLGTLGLLERENTTVLDAALSRHARDTVARLSTALPGAAVFVTRGDGTLMSLEHLARHPGLSLGSGPASALRGAGLLTGLTHAVVADVGASRIRVGALADGFPEEAAHGAEIGGVPVAFRMPDLIQVPIGAAPGSPGSPAPAELAELAEAVDRLQPAADRLPLVVVGGGAAAVPDGLPGVGDVRHPPHGRVAGAIGAIGSPVGGQAERIVRLDDRSRDAGALDEILEEARASAVRAGADPRAIEIVETHRAPLAYLPGSFVRVRVRAAGPPAPLAPPPPKGLRNDR
ncbi:hydantoinase/oxoprolinase N-terminal domain-containing protein [Microtetraspora fusca]|uniref:Hydantoinase/oxoprolinase N-terminal domain-containing protein n=1 Tax=Microtetraspora fusca TaxID=1997 RepID=A0ABW6VE24_MICFU